MKNFKKVVIIKGEILILILEVLIRLGPTPRFFHVLVQFEVSWRDRWDR